MIHRIAFLFLVFSTPLVAMEQRRKRKEKEKVEYLAGKKEKKPKDNAGSFKADLITGAETTVLERKKTITEKPKSKPKDMMEEALLSDGYLKECSTEDFYRFFHQLQDDDPINDSILYAVNEARKKLKEDNPKDYALHNNYLYGCLYKTLNKKQKKDHFLQVFEINRTLMQNAQKNMREEDEASLKVARYKLRLALCCSCATFTCVIIGIAGSLIPIATIFL